MDSQAGWLGFAQVLEEIMRWSLNEGGKFIERCMGSAPYEFTLSITLSKTDVWVLTVVKGLGERDSDLKT